MLKVMKKTIVLYYIKYDLLLFVDLIKNFTL